MLLSCSLLIGSQARQVNLAVLFDHADQPPSLELRQRSRFFNLNLVPYVRFIVLIMDVTDRLLTDDLRVTRVANQPLDFNSTCLGSFVAGYDTD